MAASSLCKTPANRRRMRLAHKQAFQAGGCHGTQAGLPGRRLPPSLCKRPAHAPAPAAGGGCQRKVEHAAVYRSPAGSAGRSHLQADPLSACCSGRPGRTLRRVSAMGHHQASCQSAGLCLKRLRSTSRAGRHATPAYLAQARSALLRRLRYHHDYGVRGMHRSSDSVRWTSSLGSQRGLLQK